jgi:hypothetical protein
MTRIAELLHSTDFAWGVIVMGILMLFMMVYAGYMRAQTLYLSYKAGTPTKLGADFYYLVKESDYNRPRAVKPERRQEAISVEGDGIKRGKDAAMEVKDIDGDMHCSMDEDSTTRWLLDHVREDDHPYEIWQKKFDELLAERRSRTSYPVVGYLCFDLKRLRVQIDGDWRVVRKLEYLTARPHGHEPANEHPEESHEWHKFHLLFDADDMIEKLLSSDDLRLKTVPAA